MYDAAPVQPIAQGILFVGPGPAFFPTFAGRGVSRIDRFVTTAGVVGTIMYILTLDAGLPGNAGEIAPGVVPIGAPPPVLTVEPAISARCQFAVRGSPTNAAAQNGTNVASVAVGYQSNATPGVYSGTGGPLAATPDGGDNQVVLVFQTAAGVSIDPNLANANGVEIVVYKAAAANTNVVAG